MVCLSYLDTSSPAHMRYAIRRLRRRLPRVNVLLGCWLFDGDATQLGEQVKAEAVAATLRDAVRQCVEAIKGLDQACPSPVPAAHLKNSASLELDRSHSV
jgi:hypothetical protein